MPQRLVFGVAEQIEFDLNDQASAVDGGCIRGKPLDDVAAAVAAAVADPLEFPRLAETVFEGDHIALAVDADTPRAADVVAGVVHELLQGGVRPRDVAIVCAPFGRGEACGEPTAGLADDLLREIAVSRHNPNDRDELAYLAASKKARPVYLNRVLCEADVVIPIGLLRPAGSLGYWGVRGGLFPTFSDSVTRGRLHPTAVNDWPAQQQAGVAEATEASWLLGAQFTVQVVAGPGDSIMQVLAGQVDPVAAAGEQHCAATWRVNLPSQTPLAAASITGGPARQTWENFDRALYTAREAVVDGGAIVLCTEISQLPGPLLQSLAVADDSEVDDESRRANPADAFTAALLDHTRQRVSVFLLSKLPRDVVEGLGMGYVANPEEVQRLSRRYESCILLADADYTSAEVAVRKSPAF